MTLSNLPTPKDLADTCKCLTKNERETLKKFFKNYSLEDAVHHLQNPDIKVGRIFRKQFKIAAGVIN